MLTAPFRNHAASFVNLYKKFKHILAAIRCNVSGAVHSSNNKNGPVTLQCTRWQTQWNLDT